MPTEMGTNPAVRKNSRPDGHRSEKHARGWVPDEKRRVPASGEKKRRVGGRNM